MPYRPTGQMIGNTPSSSMGVIAPDNRTTAPDAITVQPDGASFLAWGEGAGSGSWNRPLAQLGHNVDWLRAKLAAPVAVLRTLDDASIPALSTASSTTVLLTPGGSFDGWVYVGSSTTGIAQRLCLRNRDGSEVRAPDGTRILVTDVQNSSSVSMVGAALTLAASQAISAPSGTTSARHALVMSTAVLSAYIGSASARGLLVTIASSVATVASKGSNNGTYVIVDGTGAGTTFVLAECYYRIRFYSASGAFQVGETVTATGFSGVVTATTSDYIEFATVTGVAAVAATITGGTSSSTATVGRFTAPGDPVVLNNDVSAAGAATFRTDGTWVNGNSSVAPRLVLNQSLSSAADLLLQFGGHACLEDLDADAFLSLGYATPQPSLDRAYEVGRVITADLGTVEIDTTGTGQALLLKRASGTGAVSLFEVKDASTTYSAQVFDDAAADAPDYWYAYRLHTDLIRSYTYRKISTGPTAAIGLGDASGNVALRSGPSAGTESDILRVRKPSTTTAAVEVLGPTGTALADGEAVTFAVTDEFATALTRSGSVIQWVRYSALHGTLDGGYYDTTSGYHYIDGPVAVDGDKTGLQINTQRGMVIVQTYAKRRLLTLSGCSGTLVVGETITHSSGGTGTVAYVGPGYVEVSAYSGTWGTSSGTVTGGTSAASATLVSSVTGRSATSFAKVEPGTSALAGTTLLSIAPVGGMQVADTERQHPLLTVPDMVYADPKFVSVDIPITLLRSQTGTWIPSVKEAYSATVIPFGMQTTDPTDNAFMPIPPHALGTTCMLVSVASTVGIAAGDIVYYPGSSPTRYLGVVAEVLGGQIRVVTSQKWAFSTGAIQGGSTNALALSGGWSTTTTSAVASLSDVAFYDAKTRLAAVEVVLCGNMQGAGAETLVLDLYKSDNSTTSLVDTHIFTPAGGAFTTENRMLVVPINAAPLRDMSESYFLYLSSPQAVWAGTSWAHVHKVRAYLRVYAPNPAV